MKVEKTFEYHQLDEFSKFSMDILSFQEFVMYWWKERQYDVRIGRK